MADKKELLTFANTVKWEDLVDDEEVIKHLEAIQKRSQALSSGEGGGGGSGDKEEDLSSAQRVKLVVVGDGAVGKTSLLIRYSTGEFPTEYLPTVFENYTAKAKRGNGDMVLLHLWDTAGQEDYDRLRPLSYPGTDIVLLCFSTINKASFESVSEKWAPEVKHYIPDVPMMLVGTKVDLREEGAIDPTTGKAEPIDTATGEELCKAVGASKLMEISSKTGQGMKELFETAIDMVLGEPGSDSKGSVRKGPRRKAGANKRRDGCVLA